MSPEHIKVYLTPAELEVLYHALHRACAYEEEMVNVEARYAHEHATKASIYRALTSTIATQTDLPPPEV